MYNYLSRSGCSRFSFASRFPWLWVSTSTGLWPFVYAIQCQSGKCDNNSITYQQNDYLSMNGHQKTKEMSKFKRNCKKGIGIERYA